MESIGTDLESFGTVIYDLESVGSRSWKVLEPMWKVLVPRFVIWKVLVLGVGKSVSRDLESNGTDLESIGTVIWRGHATRLWPTIFSSHTY